MSASEGDVESDPHAVSLYLSDIHNFFQTPEVDPFLGENIEVSGVDQLMDTLKARPRLAGRVTRIVIHLPGAAIEPGLVGKTRAAVIAYCNAQIRMLTQRKRDIHLQARRALPIGFGFWTICFALSLLFEHFLGSDTALGRVFSEGFIIAGWVGLWHPAELLLYEWQPYARSIRLHEQIRTMDIAIVPIRQGSLPV